MNSNSINHLSLYIIIYRHYKSQ